ncbi:hypothetical protein JD844_000681 [Phrynosoma platyrhinos]|uniref:RNA-binding protein NOB1 n=1 Tax=Phrynosoma platyrhinos TaxID=52577 RepID=A0ABQ7SQT7_PHRPL|nr:hypothetical protein JD844_000681 [Phrynosoma platyrhinos]
MAPVEHVVADAGAFLKGAPLQVVTEIRDKETRRRLAVLPYQLHFKQPFPEYVRLVTEFSKKTGDYPSLSATDIQVLALTYQLEAENVKLTLTKQHPEAPIHVAGFHLPSKTKHLGRERQPSTSQSQEHTDAASSGSSEFDTFLFWRNPLPSIEEDLQALLDADAVHVGPDDPKDAESDEGESGEDGDEEEGWITPSNIKQIQQELGQGDKPEGVKNVLLQMGTTSEMTRLFCPHCGNKTLKKVAVTAADDGSLHMHFSRNPKVLNPRGLRYSLPAPQGGKHASNPHLTEDQRFPQQRLSHKARQKTNVFDPNYIAGVSPFAENDIYSRAANLQIRDAALGAGRRRMNPNTATKKFVKKR